MNKNTKKYIENDWQRYHNMERNKNKCVRSNFQQKHEQQQDFCYWCRYFFDFFASFI